MATSLPIWGIGGKSDYTCKKVVMFQVKPCFFSDFSIMVQVYVIPKVSSYAPTADPKTENLAHISNLTLADPVFCKRGQIEILLSTCNVVTIAKNTIIFI